MVQEKRRQEVFYAKHPTIAAFVPMMPWESVFRDAAESQSFWYNELLEPALLYDKAKGSVPSLVHKIYEPLDTPGASSSGDGVRQQELKENPPRKRGKGQGKGASQRCFAWNRHPQGCKEPCPNGRAHVCEECGGPQRSINCCHKDSPPKKGKGKNKKGGKLAA